MRLLADLLDNEYPYTEIKRVRVVVRAIVMDENGNIALHHICGNEPDAFGLRDYYETPGGGADDGEDLLVALKRECREELGYEIDVIAEIGEVDDYYNLLFRKNLNHYYLCRRKGAFLGTHFVSRGDSLIHDTVWVPLEEAMRLYENHRDEKLARLVYNREYPVLLETRNILKNLSKAD